jgi:biopolymer transport protein ExbD
MTPMIDVVFQLLIFFVCTVEFQRPDDVLDTVLPAAERPGPGRAQSEAELDLGRIELTLSREAVTSRFQGRSTTHPLGAGLDRLKQHLASWAAIDRRIPVRVHCADDVPTGAMVQVYDLCLQAGLTEVGLADAP